MRLNGRGRWLRRVWEGLRRVLRGEVWDASPLSPGEAEIEAEMAALEERVRLLFEEVRGGASVGDAQTAGAGGTPALRDGETGETPVPQRRQEEPGAEGDLRKALEDEIWARACRAEEAWEAGETPAPREEGDGDWPASGGERGRSGGEETAEVLRGVPQGMCGQMTGRAGGARFWEGVL